MDIKKLNEELDKILNENSAAARIGNMRVDNEDVTNSYGVTSEKFAHFHWIYNERIHFKFGTRCPKTKAELKKLIAFDNEKSLLSGADCKRILQDLKAMNGNEFVYDLLIKKWKALHDYRDLDKEMIQL